MGSEFFEIGDGFLSFFAFNSSHSKEYFLVNMSVNISLLNECEENMQTILALVKEY